MAQFPELNPGYGALAPEWARSICQIEARFGSLGDEDVRPGTGFLVSRKNGRCYVATAGHGLYHHGRGEYPAQVRIWIGRNGTAFDHHVKFASKVRDRCFVPPAFEQGNDLTSEWDVGLIRIDDVLASFNCFDVSQVLPVGRMTKLIGYPQAPGGSQSKVPHHAVVELVEHGTENFDYIHQKTYEGMSGGPLIGQSSTDAKPRVFGVHIRGDSQRAIRMSSTVRAELRQWIDRQ